MKNLVKSLVVVGALFGAGLVEIGAANAMPIAPAADAQAATAPIETIGWRCGYGRHINRWGVCVPNRYYYGGYYRPYYRHYYHPYYRRHYYHRHYYRRYW